MNIENSILYVHQPCHTAGIQVSYREIFIFLNIPGKDFTGSFARTRILISVPINISKERGRKLNILVMLTIFEFDFELIENSTLMIHSCMPSPLAPDPIRVQSCVCCLFWTNRNSMAVLHLSFYYSHYSIRDIILQSVLSVNGNIYFYWNYSA